MQYNDNERLKSLEHRIDMLKQRIESQKVGPEVEIERKILYGLEVNYDILKKSNGIFIAEATSVKRENSISEEELIQKLGAIYWIFGPSFEEIVSFKRYRIEFLEILPNDILNWGCLLRVKVHIYENNQPFMMNDVVLEFWKGWSDSTEIDDVGISCNDTYEKYNNFHWFQKIEYTLAKTLNKYFQTVPFLGDKSNMQYFSEQERATLDTIPDEATMVIKKFDSFNTKKKTPHVGYNELEVCVPIWSRHMEKTLLYALTSGTAYTVWNGSIYIWYKPFKGLEGSGFYKLKQFVFLDYGRTVKYFLDENEKLSNPL